MDAHNRGLDAKNGAWRVYIPVVADSHHFDEGGDPHRSEKLDPDPYLCEKLDPEPHQNYADPL
jgi:hypothetical protein